MKAFKKVTSLALALALVVTSAFTMVAFAAEAFNDVPSNHQYARAISALVDEGILEGYENDDGSYSFKPDNTVTRAEFATIISRASIETVPELTTAAAQFSDMGTAEISWAVPYVSYAVSRGVINGFPADETGAVNFKPNDPVTYGQAIKMIVCMLGYGTAVQTTDPWYQGYVNLANQLQITNGAVAGGDDAAPRGMVAQLIYNMLDTKPQVQTGVDANGNPVYSTSNNTFREEALQSETYTGQLMGVFNNTLRSDGYGLSRTQFLVGDQVFEMGSGLTAESIERYLGYEVTVSYTEDGSTSDLIAKSVRATDRNEVYVVDDTAIDMVEADYLEYWESEDSSRTTKLDYDKDELYIIQNGSPVSMGLTDSQLIELLDVGTGSIEFIDINGDGTMDVAFITSYETYVVGQKIDNKDGTYSFYDKFGMTPGGQPITLDNEDDDVVVRRINDSLTSYSDSTVSAISEDDVISVAESMSTDAVEVIVSKAKETGAVNEIDATNGEVRIGSTDLTYSRYYEDVLEDNSDQVMSTSDNVTVYLDFMGKIAYVDKKAGTENYGYITGVEQPDGIDAPLRMQFLNSSGSVVVRDMADNVRINGVSCDPSEAQAAIEEAAALVNGNNSSSEIFGTAASASASVLMRYETDNSGDIKTIQLVDGQVGDADYIGYKFLASSIEPNTLEYTRSGTAFKEDGRTRFTINSNTTVFIVPYNRRDEDSYDVRKGTSFFLDGEDYIIDAYEGDGSTPAKYVVVYQSDAVAKIDATVVPVIVTGLSETTHNNEACYRIEYYELGSETTETIYTEDRSVADDVNLQIGDVIRFAARGSDTIEEIEMLFSQGELYELTDEEAGSESYDGHVSEVWQDRANTSKYFRALFGTAVLSPISTQGDGSMLVTRDLYDGTALDKELTESYSIDNDSTVYVIDGSPERENETVTLAGTSAIVAGDNVADENASQVLVVTMDEDEHTIIIWEE